MPIDQTLIIGLSYNNKQLFQYKNGQMTNYKAFVSKQYLTTKTKVLYKLTNYTLILA